MTGSQERRRPLRVCLTGFGPEENAVLRRRATTLGLVHESSLRESTDVLVALHAATTKCVAAARAGIPVVSAAWLSQCAPHRPAPTGAFLLKRLDGLKVCVTRLPQKERGEVERACAEHGGIFVGTLDATCSVLLLPDKTPAVTSDKTSFARRVGIPTVHLSWLRKQCGPQGPHDWRDHSPFPCDSADICRGRGRRSDGSSHSSARAKASSAPTDVETPFQRLCSDAEPPAPQRPRHQPLPVVPLAAEVRAEAGAAAVAAAVSAAVLQPFPVLFSGITFEAASGIPPETLRKIAEHGGTVAGSVVRLRSGCGDAKPSQGSAVTCGWIADCIAAGSLLPRATGPPAGDGRTVVRVLGSGSPAESARLDRIVAALGGTGAGDGLTLTHVVVPAAPDRSTKEDVCNEACRVPFGQPFHVVSSAWLDASASAGVFVDTTAFWVDCSLEREPQQPPPQREEPAAGQQQDAFGGGGQSEPDHSPLQPKLEATGGRSLWPAADPLERDEPPPQPPPPDWEPCPPPVTPLAAEASNPGAALAAEASNPNAVLAPPSGLLAPPSGRDDSDAAARPSVSSAGFAAAAQRLEAAVRESSPARRRRSSGCPSLATGPARSASDVSPPPPAPSAVPPSETPTDAPALGSSSIARRTSRRDMGIDSPAGPKRCRTHDSVAPGSMHDESQVVRYASAGSLCVPMDSSVEAAPHVAADAGAPAAGSRRFLFSNSRLRPAEHPPLQGYSLASSMADATHFVCAKPGKSEHFLGAVAAGRWVVRPEFITQSVHAGRWLPEEQYEWCGRTVRDMTVSGEIKAAQSAAELAASCRVWRLRGGAAFKGWRTLVRSESAKARAFEQIIRCGGGSIAAWQPGDATTPPTHILYEDTVRLPEIEQMMRCAATAHHLRADVLWRLLIEPEMPLSHPSCDALLHARARSDPAAAIAAAAAGALGGRTRKSPRPQSLKRAAAPPFGIPSPKQRRRAPP